MALCDLSFAFCLAPPSLTASQLCANPAQPRPAQPTPPSPSRPAQPQPMNWLDTVESCLQHSLGDLPLTLVSSPANKLAS
jgi:hypothetical protein